MAVTTPDNIVTPDDGDPYALVQDLGALADSVQEAITDWKNYGIGTDAERVALTGSSNPPLKDGLLWYSTDIDFLYRYDGSVWGIVYSPVEIADITLTGVNLKARTGRLPPRARKQNGIVFIEGSADVSATTNWAGGTTYGFGTIASGFRPAQNVEGIARFGLTFAVITIEPSGAISFSPGVSTSANADQLAFALTGISYPEA